jgi:hypothetical protein
VLCARQQCICVSGVCECVCWHMDSANWLPLVAASVRYSVCAVACLLVSSHACHHAMWQLTLDRLPGSSQARSGTPYVAEKTQCVLSSQAESLAYFLFNWCVQNIPYGCRRLVKSGPQGLVSSVALHGSGCRLHLLSLQLNVTSPGCWGCSLTAHNCAWRHAMPAHGYGCQAHRQW